MFPLALLSVWKWQHLTFSCQNPKPAPGRTEALPPPSIPVLHQAPDPQASDPQAPVPIPALLAPGTTGLDLGSYLRTPPVMSLLPTPASQQRFSTHGFLNQNL